MGIAYNNLIVTNGLILCLDPANPKCFNSGQTTCKNLVTGGLVTGANGYPAAGSHTPNPANFPAYNSLYGGIFDFAGGRGMNCEENLGKRSTMSLSIWFYKNSGTEAQYFTDARNDAGNWFLSNYTSDNINYTELLTYNFGGAYNASNPDFINKWYYMVVTSDSVSSKLYLNGQLITDGNRSSVDEDFGVNFRIGTRYTTTGQWTGYMGPIFAYDRVISLYEVQQNFNAMRGRFGV